MAKKSRGKDIRRDNALEFCVSQGIAVQLEETKFGRLFSEETIKSILVQYKKYTDCCGCYIYSIKAGKGFTPIYVGSTTGQSLGREAFTDDKFIKCLLQMKRYKKGTLYITFVAPRDKVDGDTPSRRGRCPKKNIECLEKLLIAVAYRKNKDLINIQNRCLADFFINGALNSNVGRPKKEVAEFKDMMGLRSKSIVVVKTHA